MRQGCENESTMRGDKYRAKQLALACYLLFGFALSTFVLCACPLTCLCVCTEWRNCVSSLWWPSYLAANNFVAAHHSKACAKTRKHTLHAPSLYRLSAMPSFFLASNEARMMYMYVILAIACVLERSHVVLLMTDSNLSGLWVMYAVHLALSVFCCRPIIYIMVLTSLIELLLHPLHTASVLDLYMPRFYKVIMRQLASAPPRPRSAFEYRSPVGIHLF